MPAEKERTANHMYTLWPSEAPISDSSSHLAFPPGLLPVMFIHAAMWFQFSKDHSTSLPDVQCQVALFHVPFPRALVAFG